MDTSGSRVIPPAIDEELYHYWVEPNPYLWMHHYTAEEQRARAERVKRMNRPWPRLRRTIHTARDHFLDRLHSWLYPDHKDWD